MPVVYAMLPIALHHSWGSEMQAHCDGVNSSQDNFQCIGYQQEMVVSDETTAVDMASTFAVIYRPQGNQLIIRSDIHRYAM